MKQYIDKIRKKQDLTFEESKAAFEILWKVKLMIKKYIIF